MLAASAAAMVLLPAASASGQVPVPMIMAGNAGSEVAAFYQRHPGTKVWFKAGADDVAIGRLIEILRRSPFEGLENGVELAAAVEAAQAQARTGDPTAVAAAERALSQAWVQYVQLL